MAQSRTWRWNVCTEGGSCSRNWKLYKLREETLAGLENNLSLVSEFQGWGVPVRAACVPTRGWWRAVSQWDCTEGHSAPLVVTLLPPEPCAEAVTALKGPSWQNGGPEWYPVFHFVKVKQHFALMTHPFIPDPTSGSPFPELSQERTPSLGSSEALLGLLLLYSSVTSW